MVEATVHLESVTINHPELVEQVNPMIRAVRNRLEHRTMIEGIIRAPMRSGALKSSIRTDRHFDGPLTALGGVTAHAKHAAPVHQGARPHVIRPRRARLLRFYWYGHFMDTEGGSTVTGRRVALRYVRHPGNKANPFLMRAALYAAATDSHISADPI